MKVIKEHIDKNEYMRSYLLFGEEAYLRVQCRDRLLNGLEAKEDSMNYTRYEGKAISMTDLREMSQTLPFFADRRTILVENSGCFKNVSEDMLSIIQDLPQSTVIIFVEEEVDKRSKLYKYVKEHGYATELNTPKDSELVKWVGNLCKQENKLIRESTVLFLIEQTGMNMIMLRNELEKLLCYVGEREEISSEDVAQVCANQTSNKIFDMLDAIGCREQKKAIMLYHDLLDLHEPAMRILFLLTRQINILLQMREMLRLGIENGTIASKIGIPPFAVRKYKEQAKKYSYKQLRNMLDNCQEIEYGVKRGRYIDVIGVELLIVEFSS